MKAQSKTKNTPLRKTRKRSRSTSRSVRLVHLKHPILRHFRLLGYEHTGKLLHRRHTSHLALVVILIIVGFLLFMSESVAQARLITGAGSVSIGAIVPGPAPTVGAVILMPTDGTSLVDIYTSEVSGTCRKETFVVVKDNERLAAEEIRRRKAS